MSDLTEFPRLVPYVIVDAEGSIVQHGTVPVDMWAMQGNGVDRIILPDTVPDGRYAEFWSPDRATLEERPS